MILRNLYRRLRGLKPVYWVKCGREQLYEYKGDWMPLEKVQEASGEGYWLTEFNLAMNGNRYKEPPSQLWPTFTIQSCTCNKSEVTFINL